MLMKHLVISVVEMAGAYQTTYIPREKAFACHSPPLGVNRFA
jgi:hypothetical protein